MVTVAVALARRAKGKRENFLVTNQTVSTLCQPTLTVTAGVVSYTDSQSESAHRASVICPAFFQTNPTIFVSQNFHIKCHTNYSQAEKLIQDRMCSGCILMQFNQTRTFKSMKLTKEADCIQYTPNAGGSSVESETLSFEILKKYYNARLLKTEEEVAYFPFGGSKTDYVVHLFDSVIGVSVTRAFKFNNEAFSFDDAFVLLTKKLKGIIQSTKNTMLRWEKQILHVWVLDEQAAGALLTAWEEIDSNLKTNTVLLVTLASNSREIFTNPPKKTRKIRRQISKSIIHIHI